MKINKNIHEKWERWCKNNNLDPNLVMEKLMNICMEDNLLVKQILLGEDIKHDLMAEIELKIAQSLEELVKRIELLESKNLSLTVEKNINTSLDVNDNNIKQENYSEEYYREKVYLPRQEVWKRLKNTDYIKYSGYDSFLKAKGDEFNCYGIFYDDQKKRFYIMIDEVEN